MTKYRPCHRLHTKETVRMSKQDRVRLGGEGGGQGRATSPGLLRIFFAREANCNQTLALVGFSRDTPALGRECLAACTHLERAERLRDMPR